MERRLSKTELRLAASVASGRWADLSSCDENERRIAHDFLRALVLRMPLPRAEHHKLGRLFPEYKQIQRVDGSIPVTAAGIRIRGGIITGALDLADCVGAGDSALPALLLHNCRFENCERSADLNISGSVIAALSLDGCRFREVQGARVTILGHLSLAGVASSLGEAREMSIKTRRPTDRPEIQYSEDFGEIPQCSVFLKGARIGGAMSVNGANLRVGVVKNKTESIYALQLDEARISGTLDAKNSVIDGGVQLNNTVVEGEIWLGSATINCSRWGAFEGQGLDCRGIFAAGRDSDLRVVGGMFLMNARIRGELMLRHPFLDGRNLVADEIQISLDLYNSTVEGSVILGRTDDRDSRDPCSFGQAISSMRLTGAHIKGSLEIIDFRIFGERRDAVHAPLIVVDGCVRFENLTTDQCVELPLATIGASLQIHGGQICGSVPDYVERLEMGRARREPKQAPQLDSRDCTAIGAEAIRVGESVSIGDGLAITGPIAIERATIEGDLKFNRLTILDLPGNPKWSKEEAEKMPAAERPYGIGLTLTSIGKRLYLENNELKGSINLHLVSAGSFCFRASGLGKAWPIDLNQFKYQSILDIDTRGPPKIISLKQSLLGKMDKNIFDPQPYTMLAQVLYKHGEETSAREVIKLKKDAEVADRFKLVAQSLRLLVPRSLEWLTARSFGIFFGYGLKPKTALLSLLVAWVLGWGFFEFVHARAAMVIDQQPIASAVSGDTFGAEQSFRKLLIKVPCGDAVSLPLYAADVFVPLIDLRQESKCEIGDSEKPPIVGREVLGQPSKDELMFYKAFKTLYTILGWIMVSMAILTFSGIMRNSLLKD